MQVMHRNKIEQSFGKKCLKFLLLLLLLIILKSGTVELCCNFTLIQFAQVHFVQSTVTFGQPRDLPCVSF